MNSFKQMKHVLFCNISPSTFKCFPSKRLERETNTKILHYNLKYHNLGFFFYEEWLTITKMNLYKGSFLVKCRKVGHMLAVQEWGPEVEPLALRCCLISALGGRDKMFLMASLV